jgi:hypothetical protein
MLYEKKLDSILEEIMTRWGIPGLGLGPRNPLESLGHQTRLRRGGGVSGESSSR